MDAAVLLLIGRSLAKRSARTRALEKRYCLLCAPTGAKAITVANADTPDLVILDAISLRTPGDRICQSLRSALGDVPIIHIHPGPTEKINSPADLVLLEPFTQRKLTTHIERLLKLADDEIITCGPFTFNVGRRILGVDGHETQLTPKRAILLELFMRAPGQVLDRKSIMEKVWQTDYMGDTRTLDVHIRWIRQAIELDPGKPRYLKTVRGVGYCFEVPTDEMVPVNG